MGERRLASMVLAAGILLCAGSVSAQTTAHAVTSSGVSQPPENENGTRWSVATWAYMYFVPDSSDYLQPSVSADRGWLHLEGRLNYEDLEAGSAWVGYNLGGGNHVEWSLTPMLGGIFGSRTGVAPGYEGSLNWRRLEVYSEGEYVVDPSDSTENYAYTWTEATVELVRGLRAGAVTQRTRAFESEREIQRGLLVAFSRGAVEVAGHIFNPDDSSPIVVISARVDF